MESKRLNKHSRLSPAGFLKKVGTTQKKMAQAIMKMPRKKLIFVSGSAALAGIMGYMVARSYTKKFDGKRFYLKGFSKSKTKAMSLADKLRKKNRMARLSPMKVFRSTVYRVYARKA